MMRQIDRTRSAEPPASRAFADSDGPCDRDDVTISIVVNTCDRRDDLRTLLYSLNHQSYSNFEVVVVLGPTRDDSEDMVRSEFGDRVHLAHCSLFNLSCSRNVGLAHAAGDVVAFIDDDAVASRHWLRQIAEAFRDRNVAGAGGRTHNVNPGAASMQFNCGTVSVLAEQIDVRGRIDDRPRTGAPEDCWFPRFHGTNMSYRKSALLSVNGFDERFEYLFDDADIAVRLGRAGHRLQHLEEAVVYHFPGTGRNRGKHPYDLNWYCWLRSTVYFALKNGAPALGLRRSLVAAGRIISWFFSQLAVLNRKELLPPDLYRSGRRMLWRGTLEGLGQGLFGRRRIPREINSVERPLRPFKTGDSPRFPSVPCAAFETRETIRPLDDRPLSVALVTAHGIDVEDHEQAHEIRQTATALAAEGHEVHLLYEGSTRRITFEDGVYMHEIAVPPRNQYRGIAVQGHTELAARLNFSHAVHDEVVAMVVNDGIELVDACPDGYAGLVTAISGVVPVVTRRPFVSNRKDGTGDRGGRPTVHEELSEELDRRTHVLNPPPQSPHHLVQAYRAVLGETSTTAAQRSVER